MVAARFFIFAFLIALVFAGSASFFLWWLMNHLTCNTKKTKGKTK